MEVKWENVEPGWYYAKGIGSVRNWISYKPGGWWFLSESLPDDFSHDIGPFKTKAEAVSAALDKERQT
jgi:hypothetical protein